MSLSDLNIDGRIGTRIRQVRTDQSLSLDALARQAGVSRAMLSRVERGESSPTAQLLVRICGGLGITLSALFAGPIVPASPLSRYASQPTWRDPATDYLRRSVSPPGTGSRVEITEVEFPAHGSIALDAMPLPDADQHVWVLEGALELQIGEEPFRLEAGDCLMMRFDRPIRFHNPTARPTRYAVIIGRGGGRA